MKRAATLCLAAALTGCAAVRPAETPKVLRVAPAFPPAAALNAGSLAIAPVQAGGAAAARRYAYVDAAAPREVRQAASLFWDEPPPRIVERALVAGLRARFRTVTGPDATLTADRRIVSRLERFEEETGQAGGARAAVQIEVTVVRGADRGVALSGRYCGGAPVGGATASDRAAAFEAALAVVVDRLAADLISGAARSGGC